MTEESILDSFNREVQAEHALISHRMSWYAGSQSFLFTAFAIAGGTNDWKWFFLLGMPALGITLSELARRSIWAAISVQSDLLAAQKSLIEKMETDRKDKEEELRILREYKKTTCCGRPSKYKYHDRAMWAPKIIPLVFMVTWLLGLLYAIFAKL